MWKWESLTWSSDSCNEKVFTLWGLSLSQSADRTQMSQLDLQPAKTRTVLYQSSSFSFLIVDFVMSVCDVVQSWQLSESPVWVLSQWGIWMLDWNREPETQMCFEVAADVNGFWQTLTCKCIHNGALLAFNYPGKFDCVCMLFLTWHTWIVTQ